MPGPTRYRHLSQFLYWSLKECDFLSIPGKCPSPSGLTPVSPLPSGCPRPLTKGTLEWGTRDNLSFSKRIKGWFRQRNKREKGMDLDRRMLQQGRQKITWVWTKKLAPLRGGGFFFYWERIDITDKWLNKEGVGEKTKNCSWRFWLVMLSAVWGEKRKQV